MGRCIGPPPLTEELLTADGCPERKSLIVLELGPGRLTVLIWINPHPFRRHRTRYRSGKACFLPSII